MPAYFYWLGAAVVLIIIELISVGLTTVWFAAGALTAALLSWAGFPYYIQFIAFFTVSIVLLVLTRPWASRFLNNRLKKTNLDSIIGKQCIVTSEIDNLKARGQVSLNGQVWSARSVRDEMVIPEGETVVVYRISGVKLIVGSKEEEKS